MIPGTKVPFTSGELAELEMYIFNELDEAMIEHVEREERLDKWDKAYIGEPKQARRNFPWPGAANLEVPLIGITVDSIVARVINTIFAMEPFWAVRPLQKGIEPYAKPLEDYLEWSRKAEFKLYNQVRSNVIELVKYGWSYYKTGWEIYREPFYQQGLNGELVMVDNVIRRPVCYHVLNRDIITQCGVEDDDQSEWICHRIRLTDNQLRLRVRDGIYDIDLQAAIKNKEEQSVRAEANKPSRYASPAAQEKLHSIYEFWMDWPYGPEQAPVPMLVAWHSQLKKVMRAIFNPYGKRPFHKSQFITREGKKEGLGIAYKLAQLQDELSTIHRQQIDNSTLANTRFFVGRRGVIRPNTQIWPGRILPVNDPRTDLVPLQLGDIYQSQGILETRALAYAERASGISDYQLGRESSVVGSGATATGTLALIQEGNRRFDLNIRDARDTLSDVGRDMVLMNQMFRPKGTAFFIQGQDGMYTEQLLSLPPEFSVAKLTVELSATTATINKEIEKQGLIALLGITSQYYERLIQAAMLVMNPNAPSQLRDLVIKEAEGAQYLMKRIVQTFDVKSIDTVVPGLINDTIREAGGASAGINGGSQNPGMAGASSLPPGNGQAGGGGVGEGGQLQ